MIKLENCPICRGGLIAEYPSVGSSPRFFSEEFGMELAVITKYNICLACGTVFQNPRMEDEEVERYYSSGKYRFEMQSREDLDEDEKRRAERLHRFIYDNVTHSKAPTSHLDIGCSRGYLLKKIGANVSIGVDTNPEYAEDDVAVFKSLGEVNRKFELITIIHTLEHVTDPVEFLMEAAEKLDDGGRIVIEVPSSKSPGGPLRLAHTFFFEPWALTQAIARAGMRLLAIGFTPHTLVVVEKYRK